MGENTNANCLLSHDGWIMRGRTSVRRRAVLKMFFAPTKMFCTFKRTYQTFYSWCHSFLKLPPVNRLNLSEELRLPASAFQKNAQLIPSLLIFSRWFCWSNRQSWMRLTAAVFARTTSKYCEKRLVHLFMRIVARTLLSHKFGKCVGGPCYVTFDRYCCTVVNS